MEVAGYEIQFGNGLTALTKERGRADALAATLHGVAEPLYKLTEQERQALLQMEDEE